MVSNDPDESRFTTDRETIRKWAEEHGAVPVRETEAADETSPYRLQPESEETDTVETLTWDEFFQQIEGDELLVIYYGEEADRAFDVVDREQAVSTTPLEASEIEERLLAGETITSELTETTVVERTIVEHATIESEVVDTEVLDSRVVDVDLLTREIGGCEIVDRDLLDVGDRSRFEDTSRLEEGGFREDLPQPIAVEAEVEEDWLITRELLERSTIESRIVDTDVTETDEVESETLESSIEIEGVQQNLFESGIIETEADVDEIIESEMIESEFHEDDVVRTELTQRRLVEEEFTEQKVLRGELTESEIVFAETGASNPVETAFVDSEDLDAEMTTIGVTEYESTAPEATAETTTEEGTAEATMEGDETMRTAPTEDDVGKDVVDTRGEIVGMVEDVREGTAYVDPEPGLIDRIKAALDWGDIDDDAYPLEEDQIQRITDDEIEVSVPR